jgi:hypothetical protein
MLEWIEGPMATSGKIAPEDVQLLYLTDSPEETVAFVEENYRKHLERVRRKRSESDRRRPEPAPGGEVSPE